MTVPAIAAILFALGAYGVATRRNAINVLMCIEIMMNAANMNLIYFGRLHEASGATGQMFAALVIAIAAAETAVGLALALAIYRRLKTVVTDEADMLRG